MTMKRRDLRLPWRLRAGLINKARREARWEVYGKEPPQIQINKSEKKRRLPKRIPKWRIDNHGSPHNYIRVRSHKFVFVYTSSGRGRPTRRKKYCFVTCVRVFHLAGSKYNPEGAESWPRKKQISRS